MKNFIAIASTFLFLSQTAIAQNLIQDGGFDGAPQSSFGNQGPEEIQPWYFGTVTPYIVVLNNHNLVSVDGPGGFSYSNLGPESDASGVGAGITQYYIDSGSSGQLAWQYFTPTCSGTAVATAMFTNREDHGRVEGTIIGPQAPITSAPGSFYSTEGGLSVFPVTSQIPAFSPGYTSAPSATAQLVEDLNTRHQAEELRFVLGAAPTQTSPWQPITMQVPVQNGQLYALVAEIGHSVNMDNVSVELDCSGTGGDPIDTNPEKLESIRVKKECDAPVQGTHDGRQGYFWDCDLEANVQPAPFNGTFTLQEDASNISAGQAEFVSASVPCNGLGTDMLSCQIDGNAMTNPHPVSVQLFTETVSGLEMVKWQNCVSGRAETPVATMSSGLSCFETRITPDDEVVTHPVPKELAVKKSCETEPYMTEVNGIAGIGWDCEITVVANPAPFLGNFSFTENATNISGTSNGGIVSMTPQNPAWNCASNLPAAQTACEIAGAAFNPSGEETIDVQLFAPTGKEPIKWENCVSGKYISEKRGSFDIKGNCENTTWTPRDDKEPPKLSLKKSCVGPTSFGDSQRYLCTIVVSNAGGPVSSPLTLEELFANTAGMPATQYLLQLQGTTGWVCQSAPFSNGATCSISAADFNASNGHQVSGTFLIPNGTLAEQDFQNCAALNVKDETVAEAPCVEINEGEETAFEIEKTCKPLGDRMVIGAQSWVQPYECSLTVTTNGVPFTDPIYVADVMSYGTFSGNSLVGQLTSSDPWQCVQPPYAAPGQGNQPACAIQGADFPHSVGSSTVTFTMTVHGAPAALAGAENCGNLYTNLPTDGTEPPLSAQSCVTIVEPPVVKDPKLSVTKTCAAATWLGNNTWDVSCTVTISGTDLPPGEQITLRDELMSAGSNIATNGAFDTGPFAGSNCAGGTINGGVGAACAVTTDDIISNGGVINFPYTGQINGPGGRQFPDLKYPQNCTYATISSIGLNAPDTGKVCVDIPLRHSLIGGDIFDLGNVGPTILDESAVANPDIGIPIPNPDIGGDLPFVQVDDMAVLDPNIFNPIPIGDPALSADKTCEPAISLGGGTWQLNCQITVTGSNLPAGEYVSITDTIRPAPGMDILSNSLTGGSGAICNTPYQCFILPDIMGPGATGPAGATYTLDYTGTLFAPGVPSAQNCVRAGILVNGSWIETTYPEPSPLSLGYCVPVAFDQSTVDDASTGPNTGGVQSCGLDTLFVIDRSGSMAGQRMTMTKQAVLSALQIFEGGGSKSGVIGFGSNALPYGAVSQTLPSSSLQADIAGMSAGGATNWKKALQAANTNVAGMADKPLVLFISDGLPNQSQPMAVPQNHEGFTDVAIPYVTALRNQGSRVVGITLGSGSLTTSMSRLLGPNVVSTNVNSVVDPLTADVIEIPNVNDIVRTFEQIAQAYCSDRAALSTLKRAEIAANMVMIPKSASVYTGDDELPHKAVIDQTQNDVPTPTVLPQLKLIKSVAGPCAINRASQTYDCPFNLEIRNQGKDPYIGPRVVVDDLGKGGLSSGTLSGAGWSFETHDPVGVIALHGGLLLAPGESTNIRTSVIVEGRPGGGEFGNCGYLGVLQDEEWATVLLQHIMNGRGIKVGRADGKRGPNTNNGLKVLRKQLGLAPSEQLDDGLFAKLGLGKPVAGGQSCATVLLAPMPAKDGADVPQTPRPTVQCDPATTSQRDNQCVCTFSRMVQQDATSCGCIRGHEFVTGEGCFAPTTPQILLDPPKPDTPRPTLQCDRQSTRQQGNSCACKIPGGVMVSQTQCACPAGTTLDNYDGCVKAQSPKPDLKPNLNCDPKTTRARGNQCVCLFDNMTKRNETSCTCPRGSDFKNGSGCIRRPDPENPSKPDKGTRLEDAIKSEAVKRLGDLLFKK